MAKIDKGKVMDCMKRDGIKTQAKLAEAMGMDHCYLNKLLNGKPFNSRTLERLATHFRVNPGELVR